MPNLHAHYYLGNVKQFRQELDTSTSSSSKHGHGHGQAHIGSAGRSWGTSVEMRGGVGGVKTDPNERDSYGRTYVLSCFWFGVDRGANRKCSTPGSI